MANQARSPRVRVRQNRALASRRDLLKAALGVPLLPALIEGALFFTVAGILTRGRFHYCRSFVYFLAAVFTGDLRYASFGLVSLPSMSSRWYVAVCLAELEGFAEGRGLAEDAVRIAEVAGKVFVLDGAEFFQALHEIGFGLFHKRNVRVCRFRFKSPLSGPG